MKRAATLAACLLLVPAPALAADIRAVPGTRSVEVGQTFSISVKPQRGGTRQVCLFTKTGGQWRRLAACERVTPGFTYKLRVRLGGAALGRNAYVIGNASARPGVKPPKSRSRVFRIRVVEAG
jgi:hypothetical protein